MFNFNNPGEKIQSVAKTLFIVQLILVALGVLILFVLTRFNPIILLISLIGYAFFSVSAYIFTLFLYGYGELISNTELSPFLINSNTILRNIYANIKEHTSSEAPNNSNVQPMQHSASQPTLQTVPKSAPQQEPKSVPQPEPIQQHEPNPIQQHEPKQQLSDEELADEQLTYLLSAQLIIQEEFDAIKYNKNYSYQFAVEIRNKIENLNAQYAKCEIDQQAYINKRNAIIYGE